MRTVSDRIRELLLETGATASDLAKYCKKSEAAVSKWVNGQIKSLRAENETLVARFFRVHTLWLRTEEGPKYLHEKDESEKTKLFEIIETADKAIFDSGVSFTDAEKLDIYLIALEFAARQHFPSNFIEQYVNELLKKNKKLIQDM